MGRVRRRVGTCALAGLCVLVAGCSTDRAEWVMGVYAGKAWHHDGDLDLQHGTTDVRLLDVPFTDESFDKPIYYGARLTRWNSCRSCSGFALDMTHAKVLATSSDVVQVTGVQGGVVAPSPARVGDHLPTFTLTHGHNLVTFNYMHRWFPHGGRDKSFWGRMRPYAGLGAGVAVPHVEVLTGGQETNEFQLAGPAVQGLAGVEFDLIGRFATFAEYKLHYAHLDMDLRGGGSLATDVWTHQLAVGFSVRF